MDLQLTSNGFPIFTSATDVELEFLFWSLSHGRYVVEASSGEPFTLFKQSLNNMDILGTTDNRFVVRSYKPKGRTTYLVNSENKKPENGNNLVSIFAQSRHPTEQVFPVIIPYSFTLNVDEIKQLVKGLLLDESQLSSLSIEWKQLPDRFIKMDYDEQTEIDKGLLENQPTKALSTLMWRFGSTVPYGCEPIWNPDHNTVSQWIDETGEKCPFIQFMREIEGHSFSIDCFSDGEQLHLILFRSGKSLLAIYDFSLYFDEVYLVNPAYKGDITQLQESVFELPNAQLIELGEEKLSENATIVGRGFNEFTTHTNLMVDRSFAKEVLIDFMVHGQLRDDLVWTPWDGEDLSIFEL